MLKNLIFLRWLDIFLLSIISITIVNIASHSHWLLLKFKRWSEITTALPWYFQITIGIFGLYCVYKILLDFKMVHFDHRKYINLQFRYPPTYFAAILAILGLLISGNYDFTFPVEFRTILLLAIWLSVAIALNLHEKYTRSPKENTEGKKLTFEKNMKFIDHLNKINRQDLVSLHNWIHKEEPTEIDASDDFERYVYVERITKILLNENSTPCHIALTGEFGSGKSSITDTVIKHIKEISNSYIFVKVDGWGRSEKSCAAQILEEIVDVLSKKIDCSSIKNMPKQYFEALLGSNLTGSKSLAGWITKYYSPMELLKKIQIILATIDKQLLVILEDFDRQPNSDETISEIAALLERLKKYDKINFIINIGYQSNSEILSKICTRREDVNGISIENKIVNLFDLMIEYNKYINPFNIDGDKNLIPQTSKDIYMLIRTPRDLKQIFRRVYTTWEILAGEIDIYDLLMLNIIRYTNPSAFEFICININELKKTSSDKEYAKLRSGNIQYFEKSSHIENQSVPSSVNTLISRIFPNANDHNQIGNVHLLENQRVAFLGETEFFKRMLTESAGKYSDVSAIKKFMSLSNDEYSKENKTIIEISESVFLIEKFIQFYRFYDIDSKTKIINPKYAYMLLSILTNEDNLCREKNLIEYFEKFHINQLIRIFNQLENQNGAIEILKRVVKYSLDAFLTLSQYFKHGYPTIAYDNVLLEALTTPSEMQKSLKNSHHNVLLNVLDHIFWSNSLNSPSFEKFMSLVVNTFKNFPEIDPFIDTIVDTQFQN